MDSLTGATFGQYRRDARLGEGEMGEVYAATHLTIGRVAAHVWQHLDGKFGPAVPVRLVRSWNLGPEVETALAGLHDYDAEQGTSVGNCLRVATAICRGDEASRQEGQRLLGLSAQRLEQLASQRAAERT